MATKPTETGQARDNEAAKQARKGFLIDERNNLNVWYGKDTMITPDGEICEIIEDDGRKSKP